MADDRFQHTRSLSALERAAMVKQVEETARELELADPDAGASPLDRRINRAAEFIGVSILATIATIVFINAAGRYTISNSLVWGEELVISLIPWLAFTGLFLSTRRRKVIRIDTFVDMLPARLRAVVVALGNVIGALAFGYLAWYAFAYLGLFGRDPMVYFDLPKGLFQSALLAGASFVALAFLAQAWRALSPDPVSRNALGSRD